MGRFKAPHSSFERTLNLRWNEAVQNKFRYESHTIGVETLWGDFWDRFNTMQIPLFGEKEYVDTAIEILNVSKDREEFEKKFEQVNKQRREVLMGLMGNAMWKIYNREDFPSEAVRHAAFRACQTGCFQYFLQLFKGTVYGWEADIADDPEDAADASGEEIPPGTVIEETIQSDKVSDEDSIYKGTQKFVDELLAASESREHWETQIDDQWDEYYRPSREIQEDLERSARATLYIGTSWEYLAPGWNAIGVPDRDDDDLPSTASPPYSPNRSFISEEELKGWRKKGVLKDDLPKDATPPATRKRVRFADEPDDDEYDDSEPKRQKLGNLESIIIFETPSDDEEDSDDDDGLTDNHQRQRLESPESFLELEALLAQQIASEIESTDRRATNESTDEGKGQPDNTRRRATESTERSLLEIGSSRPSTRSRRSSGQLELLELDGSGNPRSLR